MGLFKYCRTVAFTSLVILIATLFPSPVVISAESPEYTGFSEGDSFTWSQIELTNLSPTNLNPDLLVVVLTIKNVSSTINNSGRMECNVSYSITEGKGTTDTTNYTDVLFPQTDGYLANIDDIGIGVDHCDVPLIIAKDFNFSGFYTTDEYNIIGRKVTRIFDANQSSWTASWDENGLLIEVSMRYQGEDYFRLARGFGSLPGAIPMQIVGAIIIPVLFLGIIVSKRVFSGRKVDSYSNFPDTHNFI